jgi:transcriptional regulator with XRE-family HTH domain
MLDPMDDVQVGCIIRSVRIRRGLRQRDVAEVAGVSQAAVSAIERGDFEATSLRLVRRVSIAVGVSLPLAPRWRGPELTKLLDERHAAIVRDVVSRLVARGWVAFPEHTFSIRGERGSIDVLAWHPATRTVLIVEVKTRLVDLQDLLSTHDRKTRLAAAIAREAGWRPLFVGSLLVMPGETQARNAIEKYRPVFDARYPARGPEVQRWLRCPSCDLRGIWFVLNSAGGDEKHRPGGSVRVRPRRDRLMEGTPRSGQGTRPTSAADGGGPDGAAPALYRPG